MIIVVLSGKDDVRILMSRTGDKDELLLENATSLITLHNRYCNFRGWLQSQYLPSCCLYNLVLC
jgi:hypothetical protein